MSRLTISFLLPGALLLWLAGCAPQQTAAPTFTQIMPGQLAAAQNQQFLNRATYDPWILQLSPSDTGSHAYLSDGKTGCLIDGAGNVYCRYAAGHYAGNSLQPVSGSETAPDTPVTAQELDLHTGTLTVAGKPVAGTGLTPRDWAGLWNASDIKIDGDPEAQQVVHANMFYLLSSTYPGSDHSIPPLGLSSGVYGGHIFWDADTWMFPALIAQHPDYARSIVDYRFKTLKQAMANAKAHGFPGAEYAWESAVTGAETAPIEFAQERHITADVALAAWQYYLWTGDLTYLRKEGWPILLASAQYWVKRATPGSGGTYHILDVLPPDETAGNVNDDAYTNDAARQSLLAAVRAADLVGAPAEASWSRVAAGLHVAIDPHLGFPAEYRGMPSKLMAKQADTLLVIYPLGERFDPSTAGKMLDFYQAHTIKNGPAMTASIHAVVAARLGRGADALADFRDSYRPFMRGPWDAFSEKRTTNNVYFLTGMAGSLESVLYGFAGLSVVPAGEPVQGHRLAGDSVASLTCDPHLPAGWGKLEVQGVRFRGHTYDVTIEPGDHVTVVSR
ncbi:MAG: glycosyl hydrolase family 65 protein [Capsulimonadaceae bacterium]